MLPRWHTHIHAYTHGIHTDACPHPAGSGPNLREAQDPSTQVLSLLQSMDASGGKHRINAYRSGAVVGLFNLQPIGV